MARSSHSTRCTAKKHFVVAAQADVDLIVGIKDKQPTLHQQIPEVSVTTTPLESAHSHDKGRSRDERRTITVVDLASMLADTDWHPHVAAIIWVKRDVHTRYAYTGLRRQFVETAFYILNRSVTGAHPAEAIRAH